MDKYYASVIVFYYIKNTMKPTGIVCKQIREKEKDREREKEKLKKEPFHGPPPSLYIEGNCTYLPDTYLRVNSTSLHVGVYKECHYVYFMKYKFIMFIDLLVGFHINVQARLN